MMIANDVAYFMAARPALPPRVVVLIMRLVAEDEITLIGYIIMCASGFTFTQLNDIFNRRIADLRHLLIRHISTIRH